MAGTGHWPAIGITWLVGDIGATNARFGLVAPGGTLLHSNTYACDDFATIDDAIGAYLDTRGDLPMPRIGALAIAARNHQRRDPDDQSSLELFGAGAAGPARL